MIKVIVVENHLMNYLNSRQDDNPALFVSLKKPYNRLGISGVERRIRKLGNLSKIKKVHPHKFRRTLATNLSERGMSLNEIKVILGHANINTTMLYICVSDRRVNNSYDRYC